MLAKASLVGMRRCPVLLPAKPLMGTDGNAVEACQAPGLKQLREAYEESYGEAPAATGSDGSGLRLGTRNEILAFLGTRLCAVQERSGVHLLAGVRERAGPVPPSLWHGVSTSGGHCLLGGCASGPPVRSWPSRPCRWAYAWWLASW